MQRYLEHGDRLRIRTRGFFESPRPPLRRLYPDSPLEHKRTSVEEAETEQGGKIQRPELASQRMILYHFRILAVTTKDLLEVPVDQDESELLLMKTLETPYLWYDTESGNCRSEERDALDA